jgi:quercetin dioxygenase-like cupin family protein
MPRRAIIFAFMLTLLTGMTIGQLQSLRVVSHSAAEPGVAAATVSASRFYEAVNMVIEFGDVSALRALLHPEFVDHGHSGQSSRDSQELEQSLLTMHKTFPHVRLSVTETVATGGMIAIDLALEGEQARELGKATLEPLIAGGGRELLRIEDGRVIERWADPIGPGDAQAIGAIDTITVTGRLGFLRLERLIIEPGGRVDVHSHLGSIIIVQSGAVKLSIQSPSGSEIPGSTWSGNQGTAPEPPSAQTIATGNSMVIPPVQPFTLQPAGAEPAVLITATVNELYGLAESPERFVPDEDRILAASEELAVEAAFLPKRGEFQLEAWFVEANQGASITSHKVDGAEVLFVDDGSVRTNIHSGTITSLSQSGQVTSYEGATEIQTGESMSANFGALISYAVSDRKPARFWLFSLTPVDQGE